MVTCDTGIDLHVIIGQIGGVEAEGFRSHPEMNADVNVILAHDFRQLFCIPGDALTLFENRDAFKVKLNGNERGSGIPVSRLQR